jgi:hypothetical protein
MPTIRMIDAIGNRHDFETVFLPRIGEHLVQTFGVGQEPVREHRYRVTDVVYTASGDTLLAAVHVAEDDMA